MITSTPTNYSSLATGVLAVKITATQTTSITVTADAYVSPSGTVYGQFPVGDMILKLTQPTQSGVDKIEFIGVEAGTTQTDAAVTLGTCIRHLSWTDGSDFTSGGNGLSFPAGTKVELVWSVHHAENTAFKNNANTFTGTQTVTAPVVVTGTSSYIAPPSMTTAQREDLTGSPKLVYDTDLNQLYQNIGGVWIAVGDEGTPTATESSEGKVELATVAEHAPTTTGAKVVQAKNCISVHAIYTPAYLTGGSSATAHGALWTGVTDGEFAITIDGDAYDITGLNFSATTDEDDVAAVIQAGIRAETGSTETCVWDTDHFVITSADTTVTSEVSVTSAVSGGSGTDISGEGATAYLDAETGQGTATDAVLNPAADEKKVPVISSTGQIDTGLLGTGTANATTFLRGDKSWVAPTFTSIFGDGSDGAKNIATSENLDPTSVYQYSSLILASGQTLGVSSVNSVLRILVTGNVIISGTIDLDGKGGAGGNADADGTDGVSTIAAFTTAKGLKGTTGNTVGGASGGGGGGSGGGSMLAGGGAGSTGATGSGQTGGAGGAATVKMDANQLAILSGMMASCVCGSGGGGGAVGGGGGGAGGAGGAGGGALIMFVGGSLSFGASSVITADGVAGSNGSNAPSVGKGGGGGGGGGSGGNVLIVVAGSITDAGVADAATAGGAGSGGSGTTDGGAGGAGGAGTAGKITIYSISEGTIISY